MSVRESRRRFLQDLTAMGVAGGVYAAATEAGARGTEVARAPVPAPPSTTAGASTGTPRLPRFALVIGPGTLPSVGKDRMDMVRYRLSGNPRLTGEQMLATLPEVAAIADVEVDQGNPWEQGTHDDLRKLAARFNEVLRSPDIDGATFIQGTNTLEQTDYFLNLAVHSDKPIVVTGAQRPFNAINPIDSIRVACAPASRGMGAVVTFNGEINAARDVTKTNTYHPQTFRTRDLGLIGYADPDKIEYYRTPHRRHTTKSDLSVEGVTTCPMWTSPISIPAREQALPTPWWRVAPRAL